jgi:hypothetical protein
VRLSKSRFKLGLECPTKLFYTAHKEYANQKQSDPFMMALAKGGFQVEEYARRLNAPGVLIESREPAEAVQQTLAAMANGQVVFEGAFVFENLYVRCDMIKAYGNIIELIEIKAKSFDGNSSVQTEMMTKGGTIKSGWKSYLWDVAFQKHVIERVFPDKTVIPYLLMADKSKRAGVNGLHEKFKVTKGRDLRMAIEVDPNLDLSSAGEALVCKVDVSMPVMAIEKGIDTAPDGLSFGEAIRKYSDALERGLRITPVLGKKCKGCEFRTDEIDENNRSGFHECWAERLPKADLDEPKPFDIWDNRNADAQITQEGILLARDLDDFFSEEIDAPISRKARQQLQLESIKDPEKEWTVFAEALREELAQFTYPLHFIDFETSTNPLPHFKGQRPYEQVAFQFSHHILHGDGTLRHTNQFLQADPGTFPNFEFVRALRAAIEDRGTIFRYSHHENTVLRQIYRQLEESAEPDKKDLQAFIDHITQTKEGHIGERNMVDLLPLMKCHYYNALMKGSNSIKQLLPASIECSPRIKAMLGQSLSENGIHSLNFSSDWIWLPNGSNAPYKSLPLPFAELDLEHLSDYFEEDEELAEGGAAAMAYGKLQYTNLTEPEREALKSALLKYCELDTLAMVIAFWHLEELVN